MSPSELIFHNATDEEVHGALIAFMTSPDARKALQTVPSSDIKRFMFLVMTPSVVEAYLAFEHSIINQPPINDEEVNEQRREKSRILQGAKEAEEAAALAADQLETFAAVAVMELNALFPNSGYADMIEEDMGGTGVWNDGVGIRCWSIEKEDKLTIRALIRRICLDFECEMLLLDFASVDFSKEHDEDFSISIPFKSWVGPQDRDRIMHAIRRINKTAFWEN